MRKVYLDNAATTQIDPEVVEAMIPVLQSNYGNPSSIHSFGRETKALIETSRRKIAKFINAEAAEIIFTSGGTEADNMIVNAAVCEMGVKHIVSTCIEHHAIGHTLEKVQKIHNTKITLLDLDDTGCIDLNQLEDVLSKNNEKTLVTLMHANNEIGNLLPLKEVSDICKKHNALFHSDTVQTMCHYKIDTKEIGLDFLSCSAHKFHGPKGIGFLYANKKHKLTSLITGGGQERGLRAGTENVYGIVGLAKAMEIAHRDMEEHQKHISSLKSHMISELKRVLPDVKFNGKCEFDSLYTVLNIQLPANQMAATFLYSLDIHGIAASGGSACSAGASKGSHVLEAIGVPKDALNIRFSFGRFNTKDDIDYTISVLQKLLS